MEIRNRNEIGRLNRMTICIILINQYKKEIKRKLSIISMKLLKINTV
jgi:hypothetical protein